MSINGILSAFQQSIRRSSSRGKSMFGQVLRVGDLAESEGVPLYVRLASSLRTRILQREWKVGDRLPPFDELARRYGVALNTVRKAIEVLSSQGLVASGRGAGTRITTSRQELTVTHADQQVARLLRYPIAAPLVRLRRWRFDRAGLVVYASIVLYRSDLFVWDVVDAEPDADHFQAHIFPNVRRTVRRNLSSRDDEDVGSPRVRELVRRSTRRK
jgi:DNA-binding transcriptional regulator YhcF (GntR family)